MRPKPKSKKSDSIPKLELEEIIGLTTKNASGLASNISTDNCAYLAGCVVVVYNVNLGTQSHLMVTSRMPKRLSCVAISHGDGRYIAAGESGNQPAVLVWDYLSRTVLAELKGHRYGVVCIDFSPDGKHLISVGFPQDGYLCLWDWRNGRLFTKHKVNTPCSILSASFSSDGSAFVTAGEKHLKIWTVASSMKCRPNRGKGLPFVNGKPVNLGSQKANSFTSVTSAAMSAPSLLNNSRASELHPLYALTDGGVLCLLQSGFCIKKWVNLKVRKSFALSVSYKYIACACNSGIVRLFTVGNLKYAGSLQYSETNQNHPETAVSGHIKSSKNSSHCAANIPDAIACQFSTSEKLVVIYGDSSIYIWDVSDVPKVSRNCVLVSHSACIWDVKNLPCKNMHDPALACIARGCCSGVSFATCSDDGTIRLWDLALQSDAEKQDAKPEIPMNQQFASSLNAERVCTINLVSTGVFEWDTVESDAGAQRFRSMAASPDGEYLAAGDCHGNLHIYNLRTSDYICFQEAHNAEVLSLSFSSSSKKNAAGQLLETHYLLASGGRDCMIHLYDVKRGFDLIESLDDHSAAITSIELTCDGCKLVSCSADGSILFRDMAIAGGGCRILHSHHQIASHGTVYDTAIDPAEGVAVTVGQDKKINTYDLTSGNLVKTLKHPDHGEPIKVTIDPSSSYMVCSYSNKSMSVFDLTSGEAVAQATGHAEVTTGVIFLPDCKHIISVAGDGCIFMWKMPALLSSRMLEKIVEDSCIPCPRTASQSSLPSEGISSRDEVGYKSRNNWKDVSPVGNSSEGDERAVVEDRDYREVSAFRYSASRLPKWAQTKVTSKTVVTVNSDPGCNSSQRIELDIRPSPVDDNSKTSTATDPDEVQTPCQLNLGDDEVCFSNASGNSLSTDTSNDSPTGQENRGIDMERHWHTIHTVYFDLPDSPIVREFKDMKVPLPVSRMIEKLPLEGSNKYEGRGTVSDDGKGLTSSKPANIALTGHAHSAASESYLQISTDNKNNDKHFQGNDLFSQHFSNLSTTLKLERRRSSGRRSFSAHFIVRRDCLMGCKKLFQTSEENLGIETFNCLDEAPSENSSGGLSTNLSKELPQLSDIHNQDPENIREKFSGSCSSLKSDSSDSTTSHHLMMNQNITERRDQKLDILDGLKIQERIDECEAALLSLDTAAEKVLQLFLELGMVDREESSVGSPDKLSGLASRFVPSITAKVQTLTDLLESGKRKF